MCEGNWTDENDQIAAILAQEAVDSCENVEDAGAVLMMAALIVLARQVGLSSAVATFSEAATSVAVYVAERNGKGR